MAEEEIVDLRPEGEQDKKKKKKSGCLIFLIVMLIRKYVRFRETLVTKEEMLEEIGNLNRLLAWGHARIIENLLEAVPDCPRMLSDKFGSEHLIKNALMERGRKIILDQETKAERDIAVAAASILARDGFLRGMKKLNELCQCELPRGAGPQVKIIGSQLVARQGRDILKSCAKLHFKTASEI